MKKSKKIWWIGSSREDLKEFPDVVQDRIGYGLYEAQLGIFLILLNHLKVLAEYLR